MTPQWYRVDNVRRETQSVRTIDLSPTDQGGRRGFAFAPGQFTMLYVYGVGEVPISISGDPTVYGSLVHTVAAVGEVSQALCALQPNQLVGVRGPYGTSWPVDLAEGNDVLIIAGGIGLAPLRPALYQILARRERYGRVIVLYGTRTPADILFENELKRWRGRFDLQVEVTVDRANEQWHGHVGVVTELLKRANWDRNETLAMLCGPEVMMRATVRELRDRGLEPEQIYLSMERNMKCGVGLCGRCQLGPHFVCKEGPVFAYPQIEDLLKIREG